MPKQIKVYAMASFIGGKCFLISFNFLTNGSLPTGKLAKGKAGKVVSLFLRKEGH